MTELVDHARRLRAACDQLRQAGARVGLVPTMGALHEGHMSLCAAVRAHGAERVVVSIFVNPLQFGAHEDLAKYPRTLQRDLELCRAHGVDLVYAPPLEAMYGAGFQTHVEVETLTQPLEGAVRPTHFRGVTTVVTKLFNAVGPCVAAFGRKDYQQWRVIERMTRDLDMPVEVLGCPIVRESGGLAMSSRNRYLTAEQRVRATAIHAGLCAADAAFRAGERRAAVLEQLVHEPVAAQFDAVDYVRLAHAESLVSWESATVDGPAVVLVAARIGSTRLIDNAILGNDTMTGPG
jgi:pantoate--beta-alanine ligase